MRNLLLGMGNPILGDDGVGIRIAQQLEGKIAGVEVAISTMVGLEILDLISGYDRLFLVDALTSRNGRPGELKKLGVEDGTLHLFSSHGVNFFEILEMGRQLGEKMPEVAAIYGVEIGEEIPFGQELSAELENRFALLVHEIGEDIGSAMVA